MQSSDNSSETVAIVIRKKTKWKSDSYYLKFVVTIFLSLTSVTYYFIGQPCV